MKIILQYSIIAITILRFVFSGTLIAQSSITGIVKAGPEGTPLIGVIVTIKETSSTTTTGSLGEYTFGVATGITITLEVSGYTSSARTIVVGPGVNTVDFWFNAVSDFDGNSYKAIVIGTQVWLGENLKAVHLNDGTNIPNVTDDTEWHNLTSPGLCWYNNDLSNSSIYGALYNWYTVGTGKLCPNGWHVFTAPDWATLETYLGGGTVAGGKLKEAGIVHWSDPNTGATNVSGFSGLPGGMRDLQNGNIFEEIGQRAFWWSSTEKPSDIGGEPAVYYRGAGYSFAFTDNSLVQGIKMCGQSVRCIRDLDASIKAPIVNTSYILNISTNAAEGGGDVTSDGGSLVTSRGICWGTNSNPTTSDYHTSDGNGTGSFTSSLTGLLTNTRYYVRAYATNGVGTTYGNQQYFTTTGVSGPIIFNSNLTYGSVTDIDNNTYLTIQIGSQLWMAENLKVTRFRDGTNISYVTDGNAWGSLITPGYCWHSNDVANSAIYGALYNWYGANTGNLCPVSWHVPTDAEWATLTNYLGGENVAGGKLKETGTTHWVGPNMGATNETGFTALPGGGREGWDLRGFFDNIGEYGRWWTSTSYDTYDAYWMLISFDHNSVTKSGLPMKAGLAVRCLKDELPKVITDTIKMIKQISAQSGGNVISDGGDNIKNRGICWSTNHNPTIDLSTITSNGSGTGAFTSNITSLTPVTTYYVRAYATNSVGTAYGNEVAFTTLAVSPIIFNPDLTYGTITDIDNNVYKTIRIGTQLWMAENLKTTKYNNNNSIPNVTDNTAWINLISPGYCWYNNDPVTYKDTYGALYNWYTVNTGNLCPLDWHIPSDAEWTILTTFLGVNAGGKLKETGFIHWADPNQDATNESGFTAIPGGTRNNLGLFDLVGTQAYWWSNTLYDNPNFPSYSLFKYLINTDGGTHRMFAPNRTGFSVRCLKDPPTATISGTTTVCQNSVSPYITFTGANGTAPYTFTYTINNGSNQNVTTFSENSVTVSVLTNTAGTYTYNLISVQDAYSTGAQTGSVTISVTPTNTITLASAVGTDAQTVCFGAAITNITYTTTGATGATFTGMPSGVTGNWATNMIRISGVPASAGIFNFIVILTGGCGVVSSPGTIIVTVLPGATALSNGPLIPGSSLSLIGGPGGMTSYAWTGPNGFSSAVQSPVVSTNAIPEMAGVYNLTVTNSSGCQNSASTLVSSNPLIVTTVNDNGIGSLRYAMNYANSTVGTDIITFSVSSYGPFTIRPQTALPAITDPVIIDGYSQPGASATSPLLLIVIDGTNAGSGSNGLNITSGNCTVKGLIINSFSGSGIQITGSGSNSILGNYIGLDFSGTVAKGNTVDGIHISGSSNNKIGGANPGEGNVISANNGPGISIIGNGAIGNIISSNSIYSNGGIGIDLGGTGLTSNDTGDPDTGPDNLQNFPVLGTATYSTGSVTISGTLNSGASNTYNLQFFASALADNTGYGEGQTYLGSKSVTTSSSGNASFSQAFAIKSSSGTVISATATDPLGNTSEFSKAIGGYQDQKVALANWPLKYTLNADGVPNITDGSDLSAIRAAFNTWAAISTSKIQFTDAGTTTSKYANAADGVNLVSFEDDQFPFSYGVLAVAAKTLQVDPVTNIAQIIDADIVVNPDFVNDIKYNLGIVDNTKNRGYFDIQSVVTHEIGHVVGLLHSSVEGATMFFTMGSGTKVRTLEQDDKSWASYLYPGATYNTTYGSITGNITYGYGGQPVAGAIVYAISTSRQDSVHAYSDAQGNYLVPGLIPGPYYIYIESLDGDVNGYNLRPGNISPYIYANTVYTDYPGEFYNKPDLASEPNDTKSIVTIPGAGSNISGINLITNKDDIRPTVVSVSPTDVSGSLVNITTNFSIKFSEAVDETSLSNATCYLTAGSTTIGGSYTFLGNNVVLFDPESVLDYGTNYTLHITTGVTDLRGNPLLISSGGQEQPEFAQSFMTISKDNVPPEINEVIPANGATGVFVNDKIMVFFSEPMNKSSVEKGFVLSSGGLVISGSFSWDDANTVVTFSPYASLKEGKTVYTITLPNSITDLSGNSLAGSTYSFTTIATAPPTIIYLGPANNSTGVPVTTPIVVDFSEPINPYTVTSTTFKLLLGSTGTTIPGQFAFMNENSRVVFTPSANLNFNQSYTINLTAGIKDVSIPTSSSLSPSTTTFTTAATITVPDILYLDPSNGVAGDKVVITGTGFDPNPAKNVVTFNGLNATVTGATLTGLITVVPQGALSGPVAVKVNGTASDNTMYFGVIPQSLNPCSNILGSKSTGSGSGHDVGLTDAVSVSGVHSTYAYVTNPDQGTVSVVNLTTSETIFPITVGDTPMSIAINPQGTKAYVTNFNSHTVSVIDLIKGSTYNKVIKTIPVGIEPYGIAVTPNGKRVYVANYYSENVSMIDEDPNSGGFDHVTANVSTGSRNGSAAATADGAMVLITCDFGLKIIDSNPADKDYNSVTANVSTGSKANGVTATGDAALAIVSTVDGHLLMINLHPENGDYSEAIIANVSTGTTGGKANASGDNLFVYLPDTKNNQILVYQIGIGTGGSGSTNGSGVSGLTFIPHNTIPIPTAPVALAISADASRLYVLDTKTGTSNNEITTVAICCGPITPAKTIGDLIIAIQDMINTGDITKLRGYALIISLNSSLRNINANRPNLAILDLNAFNTLVNTYIKNKQITSAQGNALINSATALINQLKGTKSALAEPSPTGTAQENQDLMPVSTLGVIYPNPFSQSVTINYMVAENKESPTKVQIMIYDISGRIVSTLIDMIMEQGCYTVEWKGTYDTGSQVPYGSYLVQFRAGSVVEVRKIILIKPR